MYISLNDLQNMGDGYGSAFQSTPLYPAGTGPRGTASITRTTPANRPTQPTQPRPNPNAWIPVRPVDSHGNPIQNQRPPAGNTTTSWLDPFTKPFETLFRDRSSPPTTPNQPNPFTAPFTQNIPDTSRPVTEILRNASTINRPTQRIPTPQTPPATPPTWFPPLSTQSFSTQPQQQLTYSPTVKPDRKIQQPPQNQPQTTNRPPALPPVRRSPSAPVDTSNWMPYSPPPPTTTIFDTAEIFDTGGPSSFPTNSFNTTSWQAQPAPPPTPPRLQKVSVTNPLTTSTMPPTAPIATPWRTSTGALDVNAAAPGSEQAYLINQYANQAKLDYLVSNPIKHGNVVQFGRGKLGTKPSLRGFEATVPLSIITAALLLYWTTL